VQCHSPLVEVLIAVLMLSMGFWAWRARWGKAAAQVQQNFANWFSYYRSREFVAKAALSYVTHDNTTARIGYATINNTNSARITGAPMAAI
jgi:hypothetical protein